MAVSLIEGLPQVDSGLVTLAISIVGLIAWGSRQESRTSTNARDNERNEKRLEEHEKKISDLDNKVMEKLSKIETIVANIQGQLAK